VRNFQSVAERLLPGWEIVNVGMSGRNPIQYADWLDEFGAALAPEAVLVQLNDGDIDDLTFALEHPGSNGMVAAAGAENERGLRRLAHSVLQHSALATLVYRRIMLLAGYERSRLTHRFTHLAAATPNSDRHPPVDPRIGPMMDALYRRMSAHGIPIVFVYIPGIDYFARPCAPYYPERREFFRAFMTRNHARWIDPTEDFCNEFRRAGQPAHGFGNSVVGSGHINRIGHRIVGEEIANALRGSPR
jgi:hypothetical protein